MLEALGVPLGFLAVRKEAAYYLRMAHCFQQYLRAPILPNPREILRRNVAEHEDRFLAAVRPAGFKNPASPYYHLFQLAGCAFHDLESSMRHEGLRVDLCAEAVNLANFQISSALTLFNNRGQRAGSAGRITVTTTASRQLQFALRWSF